MAHLHDDKIKFLEDTANNIRQSIIEMLMEAKSGHTAGPLGMADIFTLLYFHILKHDPKNPDWPERDRLILSNGHICPVLYATLAERGYFSLHLLKKFRQINSPLQGHPHQHSLAGIENSSGPLGQGLSIACGLALGAKLNKQNYQVFALTSDGEHNEGQTWEAIMLANKYKLNNLINIVDVNGIQIDGYTKNIMPLGDLKAKYQSFGWQVLTCDGHNMKDIINTLTKAKTSNKPVAILAKTILGKGVSFMENNFDWHGKAPNQQEAEKALIELKKYV